MSFGQALIVYFIIPLLNLLVLVVFINVIMSWLVAFNVVNPRNQFVNTVWRLTSAITEPLLSPIRRILPPLGGIDLSPIILLLLIFFIREWVIMGQLFPLLG
ncbi:MAG: YggT family protein [Oceanicaulis sp.]|uniref:YggT family protein n=1 Tax=Glycocaulis sp. TaxID=1969725 RepID=UPI0025BA722E|nr:YggT family protein [Glycocaulis sp.]MCC5980811.1 YggT family protein [Oceanicaulis sp.]MCH8520920.1 YggT family protein [Glycocaulis sp.]